MTQIIVDFSPAGTAEGLHHDRFDLGFLGHKTITRASEIEFDEQSQSFYVRLPGQAVDAVSAACRGFSGYDVARQFEVAWLNACRQAGVDPLSLQGDALAMKVR